MIAQHLVVVWGLKVYRYYWVTQTFGFATDQTLPNILFMRAKLCRAVISETVGVYSDEIGQTTMKNEAFGVDSVSLMFFIFL